MKKGIRSILSLMLVFVLAIGGFAGCKENGNDSSSGGQETVSSLQFSTESVSLAIGESVQTALDGLEADEQVAEYFSNQTSVATVSDEGIVSGVGVGEAVVKATTDKGNTALLAVSVYDKTMEGMLVIRVAKENLRLQVGDTYALNAKLMQGEKLLDCTIAWQTENSAVATVQNGNVTAVSAGNTSVTGKATYNGMEASVTVSVTVSGIGFVACPDYENKVIYKGNVFPLTISASEQGETVALTDVRYKSSNLDVAYLSTADGITTMEALKGGVVTITATFSYKGVDYSIESELYIYGTHTVSVYALGYSSVSRDHRITGKMYGDIITLSLDKKIAGRDIKCWYVNGEKIEGDRFVMPDCDVTAYAKYVNETEGDFTSSFTSSAMFGLHQATATFYESVLTDENNATNTDGNYLALGALGADGGALTFNFDESVMVSDSANVVLRVYLKASASLYLGVGATRKVLYAKNATASEETINKKVDVQVGRWIEITVPLNDFVANENVLGNFSIGVVGGDCYIDYIMLKY